jgi:formylmethanofuran--tetrahydromethanopterin N-formyltransferase
MAMKINGVRIKDTYAEGFRLYGTRCIITAANLKWALEAARKATGFATSIIACDCEADLEGPFDTTPDGRPGVSILLFARTPAELEKQVVGRVGQCVMTCPTTACFNGYDSNNTLIVGGKLRYFGDGWQCSKLIGQARYWRIPVMDGEFLVEERFGYSPNSVTGNFLIMGENWHDALAAAEAAVNAIRMIPGIILPFPGGITRSGSKIGSRYNFLKASTNTSYCPTLRGTIASKLPDKANCALEIVLCGLNMEILKKAMRAGIIAACLPGVIEIAAGNYEGMLGEFTISLYKLLGPRNQI